MGSSSSLPPKRWPPRPVAEDHRPPPTRIPGPGVALSTENDWLAPWVVVGILFLLAGLLLLVGTALYPPEDTDGRLRAIEGRLLELEDRCLPQGGWL